MPLCDKIGPQPLQILVRSIFTSAWHLKKSWTSSRGHFEPRQILVLAAPSGPAAAFLERSFSFSVKSKTNLQQCDPITHGTQVIQHHADYAQAPAHHTHSDDCWDAYPGPWGHKHLWFRSRVGGVWLEAARLLRPPSAAVSQCLHSSRFQGLNGLCSRTCDGLCVTVARPH